MITNVPAIVETAETYATAQMDRLEEMMLESELLTDLPIEHRFTPGLYSRTVFAPADTLATTYTHKQDHQFVLIDGEVTVIAGLDGYVENNRIKGPFHGVTRAGTRRIVYVHEPAIWVSFHPNPTDERDIDKVEELLFDMRTLQDGKTIKQHVIDALKRRQEDPS